MDASLEFYAVCPAGFEQIVSEELKSQGIKRIRPLTGGVAFFGTIEDALRSCLWLRSASRVLLVLARIGCASADELYEQTRAIPWQEHIGPDATIAVSAHGTNRELRNTQFSAMRVKDAICDELRAQTGTRPEVSKHRPDVQINVSIHAKKATIAIDLAGEPLHKRGYRQEGENVQAPLKEALAAGVLLMSPWARVVEGLKAGTLEPQDCVLIDPFCGGGTLVIEGAMMAADMAPGILRDYWGFSGWRQFDPEVFARLLAEADARLEAGLARMPRIVGSDIDPRAIEIARAQAGRVGLAGFIDLAVANCADMEATLEGFGVAQATQGCVVGNPPYGVRLMARDLDVFYGALQKGLDALPDAWTLTVITPDIHFDDYIGATPFTESAVYNGALETTVRTYQLGQAEHKTLSLVSLSGRDVVVPVLSDHPDQFAARLRKNAKARRKWAEQNQVLAFRLYDADLPDYAVAIDLFLASEEVRATHIERAFDVPYLLISEYQAPKSIDPHKAYRRFEDTVRIAAAVLEIPRDQVFTRVRKQAKGGGQYARGRTLPKPVLTQESGLTFELDLASYLDVGLFLDHRITRRFIATQAKDKDVLNLFAYTGSASVYAAAGGAKSVTTVDLSQTYLDWAKRNMVRNGFTGSAYRFIKEDVRAWVRAEKDPRQAKGGRIRRYDLIFVDPPTFSNSKAMGKLTWDIQRDHFYLLRDVSKLLRPGGIIIFSGNLRSFKLDEAALVEQGFTVRDITAKTIPEDFARNPKIHFCYVLQKTDGLAHKSA